MNLFYFKNGLENVGIVAFGEINEASSVSTLLTLWARSVAYFFTAIFKISTRDTR